MTSPADVIAMPFEIDLLNLIATYLGGNIPCIFGYNAAPRPATSPYVVLTYSSLMAQGHGSVAPYETDGNTVVTQPYMYTARIESIGANSRQTASKIMAMWELPSVINSSFEIGLGFSKFQSNIDATKFLETDSLQRTIMTVLFNCALATVDYCQYWIEKINGTLNGTPFALGTTQ